METLVALALLVSVIVLAIGYILDRRNRIVQTRLIRYAQTAVSLEEMELQLPLYERVLLPAVRTIARLLYRFTPVSQIAATRQSLVMAGQPGKMSVTDFQIRRLVLGLALGGGFAFVGGAAHMEQATTLLLGLALAYLGYMYPSIWLAGRIRQRQTAIQKSLPDAIDLLTVCVEAGAGFDSAMSKVVEKWNGPLSDEFERLLADLRRGRPRRDALRELAERTGVPDVQVFVSALIQADQLGVGLVKVLRVQADQMRQRRRLRAEEQAQKAPIKMLFPLIFMIFPAMYIIILGPAVLRLGSVFGGGGP